MLCLFDFRSFVCKSIICWKSDITLEPMAAIQKGDYHGSIIPHNVKTIARWPQRKKHTLLRFVNNYLSRYCVATWRTEIYCYRRSYVENGDYWMNKSTLVIAPNQATYVQAAFAIPRCLVNCELTELGTLPSSLVENGEIMGTGGRSFGGP
jgi:hypothetical protein